MKYIFLTAALVACSQAAPIAKPEPVNYGYPIVGTAWAPIATSSATSTTSTSNKVTSNQAVNVTSGSSSNVTTGSSVNVTSGSSSNVTSGSSANITSGSSANITSGSPANITSGSPANITSGSSANITSGSPANITSGSSANITSGSSSNTTSGSSTNITSGTSVNVATAGYIPMTWSGSEFIGQLSMGGQQLDIVMDTGSSHFWTMSSLSKNCSAAATCFQYTNQSVVPTKSNGVTYGSDFFNAAWSLAVSEQLTTSGGLSVPKQPINLASSASLENDNNGNGFLGLSTQPDFSPLTSGNFNFFTFSAATNTSWRVDIGQDPGYHGTLSAYQKANTANNKHWNLTPDNTWAPIFVTGPNPVTIPVQAGTNIMSDCGTTDTYVDSVTLNSIFKALNGTCDSNGDCSYPCYYSNGTATNGAQIQLPFGTSLINLDMSAVLNGYDNCKHGICQQCYSNLGANSDNSWYYGSAVYRSVFHKFDMTNKQFAVANYTSSA